MGACGKFEVVRLLYLIAEISEYKVGAVNKVEAGEIVTKESQKDHGHSWQYLYALPSDIVSVIRPDVQIE
jgi:hypothetical protein